MNYAKLGTVGLDKPSTRECVSLEKKAVTVERCVLVLQGHSGGVISQLRLRWAKSAEDGQRTHSYCRSTNPPGNPPASVKTRASSCTGAGAARATEASVRAGRMAIAIMLRGRCEEIGCMMKD